MNERHNTESRDLSNDLRDEGSLLISGDECMNRGVPLKNTEVGVERLYIRHLRYAMDLLLKIDYS